MIDPWSDLKHFTQARIARGRAGCALTTEAALDFQLAHAKARDSVHKQWDVELLAEQIARIGLDSIILKTQVKDRPQYLQRPDLGRQLDSESIESLQQFKSAHYDVLICLSNGLSSTAIDKHGLELLKAIVLGYTHLDLKLGPVCLIANARVALSDAIAEFLPSRSTVMMIGERPGLSADDSLGLYFTYHPNTHNTDADRNCVSNIRPPEGLAYEKAAAKLAYLTRNAFELGYSGVMLKDDMQPSESLLAQSAVNKLVADDRLSD